MALIGQVACNSAIAESKPAAGRVAALRRNCAVLLALCTIVPAPIPLAAAQQTIEGVTLPAEQPASMWPSPTMVDLLLARWSEELGHRYGMEGGQRVELQKAVGRRWSGFLEKNRPLLEPLVIEFIEMRLGLEPPPKKRIQHWARSARPFFERLRSEVLEGTDDVRNLLDPLQRTKFELDALKLGVGLSFAEGKLRQLEQGEIQDADLRDFWEPTPTERRRRREARGRRGDEATGTTNGSQADAASAEPADQVAAELALWDAYVSKFIRLYGLDDGQRSAVLSCLAELKQRALAHRDRRRTDIAKIEQRIELFLGEDEDLPDLERQLMELYGPIDEMFTELKRRIEQVPTARQQAAAEPDPGSRREDSD